MNILLSTDNNYVMPTGVLMTSVSMNNEDVHYHVFINADFTDSNKQKLKRTAFGYNHRISFYQLSEEDLSFFPFGRKDMPAYISIMSYARLLVTQFISESIHKLIYLDGDMIVRTSLASLWNYDLKENAIGVVHDMDEQRHIDEQRLPYSMETGYFNAGMLLINLDYWRKHDIISQFSFFINKYGTTIRHHDQDVLNSVLFDQKEWLPITYNFQSGFLFDIPEMKNYVDSIEGEIHDVEHNPAIIHYSCTKPWGLNCMHPQRFVWEYYKKQSLWKDVDISVPMTLKEKVSFFLKKNNYWFFEHKPDSLHRNIYRRVILKK